MPRAALVVSLGVKKVQGLEKERLYERIRGLATTLRGQPGVRYAECVTFRSWRDAADPRAAPPWQPYGALLVVDATSDDQLRSHVSAVWAAAAKYDEEILEMEVIDNWG